MLISDGAIVPVSLAEQVPAVGWSQNYNPPTGVGLTSMFAHYGSIYKRQAWVYIVVAKRAGATSRLPFKVYRRSDKGRDPATDTPLGRLLAKPNPRQDAKSFWRWTASTFDIYGEFMWWKNRPAPGRPPMELWPMHPSNTVVHRNTVDDEREDYRMVAGTLAYWIQAGGSGVIVKIPEADVVHHRTYNPDDLMRGLSPLEPLRQTLLNEDAARRATTSFWARGARPGFALAHPGVLTQPAQMRLKAQFDAIAAGADRTGATVVLEEGMKAEKLDLTAEEAQYIETRKLNREEVCGVYDMPPPVVHILDRATFSNITEQMRSLYRDTMAPLLGGYESVVNDQLAPDFGDDSLYGEFLMDEVLRGSFEARMQAYKDSIGFGIQTPGEVRELENLPDLGADTHRLYMNSTMIPLGSAAGANPTGTEVIVTPQRTKAITTEALRTVMGRLSRVGNVADIDPKALTAGLNGDTVTVLALLDAAQMADDDLPTFRDRLRAATTEVHP